MLHLTQDIALGAYDLWQSEDEKKNLRRVFGARAFVGVTDTLDQKRLSEALMKFCHQALLKDTDQAPEKIKSMLRQFQERALAAAVKSNTTFSYFEAKELAPAREEKEQMIEGAPGIDNDGDWKEVNEWVEAGLKRRLNDKRENSISKMVLSGARGNWEQVRQILGLRGEIRLEDGKHPIKAPVRSSFYDGIHPLEYFACAHATRRGMLDKKLVVADAGDLTRNLVEGCYEMVISGEVCSKDTASADGITIRKEVLMPETGGKVLYNFKKALYGRVSAEKVVAAAGHKLIDTNTIIDEDAAEKIAAHRDHVRVRSPLTCRSGDGICQWCYGYDLSLRRFPEIGYPVGILAAQSIGERGTQLAMRTFHVGTGARELDVSEARKILIHSRFSNEIRKNLKSAKELSQTSLKPPEFLDNLEGFKGFETVSKSGVERVEWPTEQDLFNDLLSIVLIPTYKGAIDPRHFEVVLRSLIIRQDSSVRISGLEGRAKEVDRRGFLAVASYRDALQTLVQTAVKRGSDTLNSLKANVLLGGRIDDRRSK